MRGVAIIVIIVCLVIFAVSRARHRRIVVSGLVVNLVSDRDHARDAERIMVEADERMIKLLDHLRVEYKVGATDAECAGALCVRAHRAAAYQCVSHLLRNFNYESVYEHRPTPGRNVAYSLNKGASIMLCLRDDDAPGGIVDINTLMFVILHEAAHIANYDNWGHGPRFWSVFKFVLNEARVCGIYQPVDYARKPVKYCGFGLYHNPLFDTRIEGLDGTQ